jgi:hypothetical protein
MRENLTTGELPFRKAYLGSIVDRIEVDDCKVRIIGRKDVLEQAVLASASASGVRSLSQNGAPDRCAGIQRFQRVKAPNPQTRPRCVSRAYGATPKPLRAGPPQIGKASLPMSRYEAWRVSVARRSDTFFRCESDHNGRVGHCDHTGVRWHT